MSTVTGKISTGRKVKADLSNTAHETGGTEYLETLLGYNASRAAHTLVSYFLRGVGSFDLRTVDFSVLSVIGHRPGVTSRQLCQQLNVLPPNMVVLLRELDKRGLIERQPHPTDRRAVGLLLSKEGKLLMKKAEKAASNADLKGSAHLSPAERKTLTRLLQKIYLRTE
ncbi:MAG: Multidrug resistance operon repressor [Pseudomonadota bacterium]|jgi:DNA-binding MarR family transcriptional regulator